MVHGASGLPAVSLLQATAAHPKPPLGSDGFTSPLLSYPSSQLPSDNFHRVLTMQQPGRYTVRRESKWI